MSGYGSNRQLQPAHPAGSAAAAGRSSHRGTLEAVAEARRAEKGRPRHNNGGGKRSGWGRKKPARASGSQPPHTQPSSKQNLRTKTRASWRCRIAPARQRLQAHPSRTMHLAGPTIAERAVSRCHLGEHPMSPRHGRPRPLRHTPKGRWARAAPSALLGAVKCPLGAHKAATGRTGGRKSLSTKFVDFRPEKRSFPESAISGTAWALDAFTFIRCSTSQAARTDSAPHTQ